MPDHIVFRRLILIFFQKFRSTGKGDLSNVLLHLVSRHAKAVVNKL